MALCGSKIVLSVYELVQVELLVVCLINSCYSTPQLLPVQA